MMIGLLSPRILTLPRPRPTLPRMARIVCVNHHLYQEGDAYGLIYAILLNMAVRVGGFELHALFYVNGDDYDAIPRYRAQVDRRLGYFRSFGLLGRRVKLVFCRFHDDAHVFSVKIHLLGQDALEVRVNPVVFKRNPRKVSLALTGQENDIGKEILKLREPMFEEDLDKFPTALRMLFQAESDLLRPRRTVVEGVDFRYISYSTDYVVRCTREIGFERVTETLVEAIMTSTTEHTANNERFLQTFMAELLQRKTGSAEAREQMPLILLFWIRGAKDDEKLAIETVDRARDGGKAPSPGKPQHHTNHTLYKQVRELSAVLGRTLQRKVLFVPIGDELKETGIAEGFSVHKKDKAYNLIEFFYRPTFRNKPMGAQMNFLTLLAMRYPVVQVGMRSGSMERLMYLGVPTIYFDRTVAEEGLPPLVGSARIRQLCGLQGSTRTELKDYLLSLTEYLASENTWNRGYPYFFHIENRDTGFMRYSSQRTSIEGAVNALIDTLPEAQPHSRLEFNLLKSFAMKLKLRDFSADLRRRLFSMGGLAEVEAERFILMLWFVDQTYPNYASRRRLRADLQVTLRLDEFGRQLIERRNDNRAARAAIQNARAVRRAQPEPEMDLSDLADFW